MRRGGVAVLVSSLAAACGAYSSTNDPSASPPPGGDGGADAMAGDAGGDASLPCDPTKLASDPKNCGVCAHDCLGGACATGACQPSVVATSPDTSPIVDLVVDDHRIVWFTASNTVVGDATPHGLYTCPTTGCTSPPSTLVDDVHQATSIVSDGSAAYVGFEYQGVNGVFRIDGTSFTRVGGTHPAPASLHYDGTSLLFLSLFDGDAGPSSIALYQTNPKTGVEALRCNTTLFGQNVESFALADGVAYLPSLNDEEIASCVLATGAVATYTSSSKIANSIAAGSGQVLWVDSNNELQACAAGTTCSNPTAVASVDGGAKEVAWSAGSFYVTGGNGDLLMCDTPTCSSRRVVAHAETIGSSQPVFGHGVAADSTAIYYAASDGGAWQILRVAK